MKNGFRHGKVGRAGVKHLNSKLLYCTLATLFIEFVAIAPYVKKTKAIN